MRLRFSIVNLVLVFWLALAPAFHAQSQDQPKPQDRGDVVRVFTELVQTDVTVLDKSGRFVSGLKASDFELKIDGQPKPIEFFEKVTAGSVSEESQLAAARGSSTSVNGKVVPAVPLDRGRPVFFYLDDLHLDVSSLKTAHKLIAQYIEKEMGQNDEAAITSASGQIGFLQQLTDNKTVLKAALERLKYRSLTVRDYERPPMSEYQATLINSFDRDVTDYFVEETMKNYPGIQRQQAEALVNGRVTTLLNQSARITLNTLLGLESLVKSAKAVSGRKLVFFISDGFLLDNRTGDTNYIIRRITSAAAKSNVVIYAIDARGLVANMADATGERAFDPSGRLSRSQMGELVASQQALNALAADTGGRAFFNSNSYEPALKRTLNETASYYLLAWRPESEAKSNKFRKIEVKVIGKPDLKVQVRRGFFDVDPEPAKTTNKKKSSDEKTDAVKNAAPELQKLIAAPYPDNTLPISLTLSFSDTPGKGLQLSALMAIDTDLLSYAPDESGKPLAEVEVTGRFLNDKGQQGAEFSNKITVRAPSPEVAANRRELGYGHTIVTTPGLYQVRVAARDVKSGKAGSAQTWIEIPNVASGEFALSSPIIGKRGEAVSGSLLGPKNPIAAELTIARTFTSSEFLRFLIFVYNAQLAPSDGKPDIALQLQVLRDNQPAVTAPLKKIAIDGVNDLKRIPYAAEMALDGMRPGNYLLKLTVLDLVSKRSTSQETRFTIH